MSAPIYTPAIHASVSTLKPIKVLSTSTTGEHGPWAVIEFEGGFSRSMDLPTHIDAYHIMFDSLDWHDRWKLRDAAALVVPVGDGTKKVYRNGFSFRSTLRSKRGALMADNYFDVPAQEYGEGWLTGYKVARELLQALKNGGSICDSHDVHRIMKAAAIAADENSKCGATSRRGASCAFFTVIAGALRGAAKHTDFGTFIDRLEAEHADSKANMDAHYAEQKAQSIAKGVATRKAKREAMKGG